jgi:hypothetical protein
MSDETISQLRRRMIEDMTVPQLQRRHPAQLDSRCQEPGRLSRSITGCGHA